jgi:hypothetical protein
MQPMTINTRTLEQVNFLRRSAYQGTSGLGSSLQSNGVSASRLSSAEQPRLPPLILPASEL